VLLSLLPLDICRICCLRPVPYVFVLVFAFLCLCLAYVCLRLCLCLCVSLSLFLSCSSFGRSSRSRKRMVQCKQVPCLALVLSCLGHVCLVLCCLALSCVVFVLSCLSVVFPLYVVGRFPFVSSSLDITFEQTSALSTFVGLLHLERLATHISNLENDL
jgi:hypothetical protein